MRAVIKVTGTAIKGSSRHHNVSSSTIIRQCSLGDQRRTVTSSPSTRNATPTGVAFSESASRSSFSIISSLPLHQIDIPIYCRHRESDEDDDGNTAGSFLSGDIIMQQQCRPELPSSTTSQILQKNLHHRSYFSSVTNNNINNTTRSHQIQQCRSYTMSPRTERAPQAAILALGSVALTAKAGQYAVQAYTQWKESQPASPTEAEDDATTKGSGGATASDTGDAKQKQDTSKGNGNDKDKEKTNGSRENIFEKYFNMGVGSKYYDGGFEDKMTRREAALILGVRESSTEKRIKEGHRKLLILNHPDTGGSTYLSGKINEAKDLLLKGRRSKRR